MLNLISSIFAINSILALLIGAYVYFAGKKRIRNAIWLVYNILFSIWNFCVYQALESEGSSIAVYWYRSSLAAFIFLVPVFLHLLSIYSDREVFKKQILGKVYILFFLFFAFSFIAPKEFVENIVSCPYLKYIIVPGLAFNIFALIFVGFLFCGFYYLLRSSKLYLMFRRNQRMWLFWGMLLGIFAPLNFLLAVYRINFFPVGLLCVIPSLILVGYAILKYHVLEFDILINKTVVMAYFTLFVLLLHMFIVHVLHRMVGVEYFTCSVISGGIVLINLLFIAHYSGVLKLDIVTNRIVYEKKLDYYKFLENFGNIADKTLDLANLANYTLDSLTNAIGIESATLYLYNEEKSYFELIAYRGVDKNKLQDISKFSAGDPLINFLREGNIYVSGENKDFAEDHDLEKIRNTFEKINIKLSIPLHYSMPLYYRMDIVGFINLGNKKDDSPYNAEDIDILNAFGRQLSICIDNAKLYSHAIEDDLTKLYRVNYFNKRIEEEIERANRYSRPFSLILMDIDDFKKINDTFGHQTGDEALKRIAHLIKSNIRKADIAARYGGEEFGILMPETNKSNALIAAERLRKVIEEDFSRLWRDPVESHLEKLRTGKRSAKPFSVTVSMGIADYKVKISKYELVKEADEALYKAKREGKNRVC